MASRTTGENLRQARLRRGLTQAQVAKKIRVTRQYYGQMECGVKRVNPGHLVTICRALDISVREALEGVSEYELDDTDLTAATVDEQLLEVIMRLNVEKKIVLLQTGQALDKMK